MAYLSELLGRNVTDIDGERVGRLEDVLAAYRGEVPHPLVVAILVKRQSDSIIVPYLDIAVFVAPAIPLNIRQDAIIPYQPAEEDLFLARDVLDKQIIDTNGVRVVRVNDLEITRVNGTYYVANVDIGGAGILRRMGLGGTAKRLAKPGKKGLTENVISWEDVELLRTDQTMLLKVPVDKMAELHPADLAEIISDLNRSQSGEFLRSLDIETLADTLEEVEPDFQASLVEGMPDERVADVLEEMAPDEAADLLAELPKDRSEDLLELMEDEEAEDVRNLLIYPDDSAGGIMNTEYIALPPDLTAAQAIEQLRATASEAETIFYVYVTDDQNRLRGVFSLKGLILAHPDAPLSSFMVSRLVSVTPYVRQNEVAKLIAKYDLLAIPVVDEDDHMLGIVTSDDALDKIIPTAWKKRLPRYYR